MQASGARAGCDAGGCGICGSRLTARPSYNVGFLLPAERFFKIWPSLEDVVIVSAVRTPVGKFQGSLSDFSAPQLGAIAVREAVKRAGIDPNTVDECIMGNVVQAGLGQNPARQAALGGGLSSAVSAP